jgi:hypothetical protein
MNGQAGLISAIALTVTLSGCSANWKPHLGPDLPDAGSDVRVEVLSGEFFELEEAFLDGDMYVGATGRLENRRWIQVPASDITYVEVRDRTPVPGEPGEVVASLVIGTITAGVLGGVAGGFAEVVSPGSGEAVMDAVFDVTLEVASDYGREPEPWFPLGLDALLQRYWPAADSTPSEDPKSVDKTQRDPPKR